MKFYLVGARLVAQRLVGVRQLLLHHHDDNDGDENVDGDDDSDGVGDGKCITKTDLLNHPPVPVRLLQQSPRLFAQI